MAKCCRGPIIAGYIALLLSRVTDKDHNSRDGGEKDIQNDGSDGCGTSRDDTEAHAQDNKGEGRV